jgi:hypothetical protein
MALCPHKCSYLSIGTGIHITWLKAHRYRNKFTGKMPALLQIKGAATCRPLQVFSASSDSALDADLDPGGKYT